MDAHTPAFRFSDTPGAGWSFPVFAIGVLALAVIVTPMFNAVKGSILIPALFHFQVNGPIWPDAQPWDTVVYALITALVAFLNRREMFTKGAGPRTCSCLGMNRPLLDLRSQDDPAQEVAKGTSLAWLGHRP